MAGRKSGNTDRSRTNIWGVGDVFRTGELDITTKGTRRYSWEPPLKADIIGRQALYERLVGRWARCVCIVCVDIRVL